MKVERVVNVYPLELCEKSAVVCRPVFYFTLTFIDFCDVWVD